MYCAVCGKAVEMFKHGIRPDGARVCYECCAVTDRADMEETGRAVLYLTATTGHDITVTNWPGTLRINVRRIRKGRHNIAGTRYDVWFTADNRIWHGVQYGEGTQIVYCKRLKVS